MLFNIYFYVINIFFINCEKSELKRELLAVFIKTRVFSKENKSYRVMLI
ncbi:hypothetical protein HNP72_003853 [Sphingobacterium soli]|nr:hypothetical protein [Sphingobacterium soli]